MRLLLTGADGFTGQILSEQAQARGYEVYGLVSDITDKEAMAVEVARVEPEVAVHLAGISFVAHADDAAFYQVNVIGTQNLLGALAALPTRPQSVILAGSALVYGNSQASPIAEIEPVAPPNHYALSKLAMEYIARTYLDRLPIIITRPFNYTGPGQAPEFLIPKLVRHFAQRATMIELGNLDVEREFNDVRMVCEAYLALLQKGVPGELYNVCSGSPHTLREVMSKLERLTDHTMKITVNPAFVRPDEVRSLYGSADKLERCIGELPSYELDDTLRWMLASAS
jgi:nucleoside-diphosphate-sugar epimerase